MQDPKRIDWFNLERLKEGSVRQRNAAETLEELNVFNDLKPYNPALCGTIPIDCDIPTSDLDVVCTSPDLAHFMDRVIRLYTNKEGFYCEEKMVKGMLSVVCRFMFENWPIEIVCQRLPVEKQRAFGHMLAEAHLLFRHGSAIKTSVRKLKSKGHSTEEAFASVFSLPGDPYEALMEIYCKEFNIKL